MGSSCHPPPRRYRCHYHCDRHCLSFSERRFVVVVVVCVTVPMSALSVGSFFGPGSTSFVLSKLVFPYPSDEEVSQHHLV